MAATLFDGWADIGSVVLTAVLAYVGVVLLVRVSGKRTLAQLNAFDWIVTVAFGSALATTILSPQVAVAEGLAAFATLVGLQFVVTFASSRSRRVTRLLKNEPTLVVRRGDLLHGALRRERLSEEDVMQGLRAQGVPSLEGVTAVVLETDGSFAVITGSEIDDAVLEAVQRPDAAP